MIATLAIQTEAWLQEELAAQKELAGALSAVELAARAGSGPELERRAGELQTLLGAVAPRESRRVRLFERLAAALALPVRSLSLSALLPRLAAHDFETRRLETLRDELRSALLANQRTSRTLAALAHYHRGLLEEICDLLAGDVGGPRGHLVDATG